MLRRNGQGRPEQHRLRRFFRLRTVRAVGVLIGVFFGWVAFSVGQALSAPNGGSISSKLAEWARDHYLGPVVTFGEWVSYEPPKVGGNPSFSLVDNGHVPASVQDLADLLQRAGAVEGLQLDINPFWMSYEYYRADGHPSNPTPVALLPTQQQTVDRYYSPYSRDFTAVYAR